MTNQIVYTWKSIRDQNRPHSTKWMCSESRNGHRLLYQKWSKSDSFTGNSIRHLPIILPNGLHKEFDYYKIWAKRPIRYSLSADDSRHRWMMNMMNDSASFSSFYWQMFLMGNTFGWSGFYQVIRNHRHIGLECRSGRSRDHRMRKFHPRKNWIL